MSRVLVFKNSQRTKQIDARLLRKITLHLLTSLLGEKSFEIGIRLVGAEEMGCVNETFLEHSGSTDVITFDHCEAKQGGLHGEIFISIDDAVAQAKEFKT